MEEYMKNITILDHPLIKHKITHLCDIKTGTKEFPGSLRNFYHQNDGGVGTYGRG